MNVLSNESLYVDYTVTCEFVALYFTCKFYGATLLMLR